MLPTDADQFERSESREEGIRPSQGHLFLELAARVHRLEDELDRLTIRQMELENAMRSRGVMLSPDGRVSAAMLATLAPRPQLPVEPVAPEAAAAPAAPRPEGTPPGGGREFEPPVEIVRDGVPMTPEVDAYIEQRLRQLEHFYRPILSKRLVLEGPVSHHQRGGPFTVKLYVDVPGRVITTTHQRNADLHVAVRQTFDAAQRQLEDHARRQRGDVSPTEAPPRARVVRLFPELGYGFIADAEGREIYFHGHSVLEGRFEELEVGMEVRFAEEIGEEGLQASSVAIL